MRVNFTYPQATLLQLPKVTAPIGANSRNLVYELTTDQIVAIRVSALARLADKDSRDGGATIKSLRSLVDRLQFLLVHEGWTT